MARKSSSPGSKPIPGDPVSPQISGISGIPAIWQPLNVPFLSKGKVGSYGPPGWSNASADLTQEADSGMMQPPYNLEGFANVLVQFFMNGVPIEGSPEVWFATIDSMNVEDYQVNAMTRVSPSRPTEPRIPSRSANIYEDRARKPFAKKKNAAAESRDLLLSYPFMMAFSFWENIRLYQEFAHNEVDRLRGKPSEARSK
jgi:hypothetical protein